MTPSNFAQNPFSTRRLLVPALWVLALIHAANGLFMFFAPQTWFFTTPGVIDTGSFNPHFVRDIGAAYIMTAVAAGMAASRPSRGFPLMALSSIFVGLHAVIHVWDIAAGRCGDPTDDIVAVIIPALVWLGLTVWMRNAASELAMDPKDLIKMASK